MGKVSFSDSVDFLLHWNVSLSFKFWQLLRMFNKSHFVLLCCWEVKNDYYSHCSSLNEYLKFNLNWICRKKIKIGFEFIQFFIFFGKINVIQSLIAWEVIVHVHVQLTVQFLVNFCFFKFWLKLVRALITI